MRKKNFVHVLKYAVYALVLTFLYVLQTVPFLFEVKGIKPMLVIPAAVVIAVFEGEFAGGMYGALAGLFCDVGGFSLFGFRAIITMLCCVAVGMLVIYLLHGNLLNSLVFTIFTLALEGSLDYIFTYGIWRYDNSAMILTGSILPTALYSVAVTPVLFWLVRMIHRRVEAVLQD